MATLHNELLVPYYSERLYMEYRKRFHDRLTAIDGPHPLAGSSWKYDSRAAREARIALVERQRRIETIHPSLLTYDEFLDSLYWVCLSDWLKCAADYRCQDCRRRCGVFTSGRGLNVHHKTYIHRGLEYPDHLDDLEVLCKACHSLRHSKGGV